MFCLTNTGLSNITLIELNQENNYVRLMLCSTMDENNLTLTNLTTTDRQMDRQTNKQTDGRTDGRRDGQQTDGPTQCKVRS
jgi:hypothetical protein